MTIDTQSRIGELEASLAAREETLYVVAHDLRSPLNILTMGMAILRQSPCAGQELNLERMARALEVMSDLIANLVDLTDVRYRRQAAGGSRIYPDKLLADVAQLQRPAARRFGLALEAQAPPDLPAISADYEALLRTFNDLRLVLGTRLDVSEDMGPIDPEDPDAPALAAYEYLGWLLECTVDALTGGLPEVEDETTH